MNRFICLAVSCLLLAGCAQFTTNDQELADMNSAAEAKANNYVECLKREAAGFSGSTDTAFLGDAARSRCQAEMDAYTVAQSEYLGAQYMMTDKELEKSVEALDERGRYEIAEMLVTQPTNIQPSVSAGVAVAAAGTATVVSTPTTWNADQRVYLDCMQDQAEKYADSDEGAEVVAAVAASRCNMYLGSESRQALEQKGRAQVMGTVMDIRMQTPR
jgi:hypothetical protein